jgi:hypothetical protein
MRRRRTQRGDLRRAGRWRAVAGGVCDDEHVIELGRETPRARVVGIGGIFVRRYLEERMVK